MTTKHSAYDWDDNILHMPTRIKMDKKEADNWLPLEVEPAEFARIRGDKENYRLRNNDPSQAFDEFVDFGPRGNNAFLEDVSFAIQNGHFGPCWDVFINSIKTAQLFAIVTSRSHEYVSIRKGVEYIINNVFTLEDKKEMYANCCGFGLNDIMKDSFMYHEWKNKGFDAANFTSNVIITRYLNSCRYYGVGLPFSNNFKNDFAIPDGSTLTIQDAKRMALSRFFDICNETQTWLFNNHDYHISLGFSDDDKKTVELIKQYFKEKSSYFPTSKLYVYETSNPKIKGGVKHKFVEGEQI